MKYKHIVEGRFLERPNRFIARVEIGSEGHTRVETVHVKNTGRCRELLQQGVDVYLEKSDNSARSTGYDLVAVKKGKRIINMDSQAPNKAVEEWLQSGVLFADVLSVRPETKYGNSRFDFYIETKQDKIFMEVKGVTLENDGVVLFPDAPSDRAVKHLEELAAAKREGYRTFVMFVIQMQDVKYFTPNSNTHPQFAQALCAAAEAGVEILAYDCAVTPKSMAVRQPVPVVLHMVEEGTSGEEEPFGGIKGIFRKNLEKYILADISIPLLKWYDIHRRILPWRENPSPYRVWVSEIMLQQTRVEAVKLYFERFMEALPDIKALAEAKEEVLLKLWEGLGYYNRVRNLQSAAQKIQKDYGGQMPDTFEELCRLPGIGSYTAGAIASIAFNRPVPAVDGNVLRVAARLRRDERLISDAKVRKAVEQDFLKIIPHDRPGDFNQAMMEIGACVCIPHGAPLCGKCPLRQSCMAHAAGMECEYPKKQAKKPRQIEDKTILVVQSADKTAIRKRADKGLLAGMYEFPSLEGFCTAEEIVKYLTDNGLRALAIQSLGDAKHIFTHKEWHMKGYMVRVDKPEKALLQDAVRDWIYIEREETRKKYPIPSAFGVYAKMLGWVEREKDAENEEEEKQ